MQVLERYRTDAINAQHSLIGIIMASIVFSGTLLLATVFGL